MTTAYLYKEFLFKCWPEIEKGMPFSVEDIQNNHKYIERLFISLLEFNAVHIDRNSLIWSDTSWLFSELLEKIFGLNCFEKVDKKECFRLMNYFKNNSDMILACVYSVGKLNLSMK